LTTAEIIYLPVDMSKSTTVPMTGIQIILIKN
jgi:hypothetical protein